MRTLWIYIRIAAFFISSKPDLNKAKKLKAKGDDEGWQRLLKKWYDKAMILFPKLLGLTIEVSGKENIITDRAAIYISNHQSYPDPIAIFYALGFVCPVLAKKEVMKIPIISSWMELFDCVYIDREDARKSVESLNQAAVQINDGRSFIIFPEGTRTHDGSLGEFKAGAFKVAEKTKAPLVPICIHNMNEVMPRGSMKFHKANVKIDILPAIDISGMSRTEIRALPAQIKEMIAEKKEEK